MNKSLIATMVLAGLVGLLDGQNLSSGDRSFVENAAKGGMLEVQMGRIGVEKASGDKVKRFSQMIVDEHGKTNSELMELAQKKGVSLPAEMPNEAKAMPFAMKSGSHFDMAYTMAMVEDHKKDVAAFEKASKTSDDPELKAWAAKTLPTLRAHLKQAQMLHKSMI